MVPEYEKFDTGAPSLGSAALTSQCFKVSDSTEAGTMDSTTTGFTTLANYNIPTPALNGLGMIVQVFYGKGGCATGETPDQFKIDESTTNNDKTSIVHKSVTGNYNDIMAVVVESDAVQACMNGRGDKTDWFAAGFGTQYHPYGICNPAQFNLIGANFNNTTTGLATKTSSFEMLADLDFQFGTFVPVGESITTVPNTSLSYSGMFNGKGKRLDNIKLSCTNGGSSVGIFRQTSGATIQNLTANKVVIDCNDKNVSNVGGLVGKSESSIYQDIKLFGYVGGGLHVGGLIGYMDNSNTDQSAGGLIGINVEAEVLGTQFLGGIIGEGINISNTTGNFITKSSVKVDINSHLKGTGFLGLWTNGSPTLTTGQPVGSFYQVGSITATIVGVGGATFTPVAGDNIYTNGTYWYNAGKNSIIPFDSYAGGLVGFAYSTTAVNVSSVAVKNVKINGSRKLGGMFGSARGININDSYVNGFIKSNGLTDQTATGLGSVEVAGISGYLDQSTLSYNIVNVLTSVGKASDTSYGVVCGTCSSISYTGLVALNNGGVNSNTSVATTAQSFNYSGNFSTFDLIFTGIGAPSTSFAPLTGSLYFDTTPSATTNCYIVSGTTWSSTNSSNCVRKWVLPAVDKENDSPRLAWEIAAESKVPYLKRDCSGLYTTPSGSGTSSASPQSICTWSQFGAMASGSYYSLKKDLYWNGTSLSGVSGYPSTGMIASGEYHLDGGGHTLSNFSLIPNNGSIPNYIGLFSSLSSNSVVKNLNIIKANFEKVSYTPSASSAMGILSGFNMGQISNVHIDSSIITLGTPAWSSSLTTSLGGLVGANGSTGSIFNSEVNSKLSITQPLVSGSASIYAGGITGSNEGTITAVRVNGELSRRLGSIPDTTTTLSSISYGCLNTTFDRYGYYNVGGTYGYYGCGNATSTSGAWTAVSPINSNEYYGGAVGLNNSTAILGEIDYQGSMNIMDFTSNTSGYIGPFVGSNAGSIHDVKYQGSYYAIKADINSVVGSNAGTITRMIIDPFAAVTGVSTTSNLIPSSGVSETVSTISSIAYPLLASYSGNSLTFNRNGSPVLSGLTDWNIGTDLIPDMTKTWQIDPAKTDLPDLMRTGGSFEQIGLGF